MPNQGTQLAVTQGEYLLKTTKFFVINMFLFDFLDQALVHFHPRN